MAKRSGRFMEGHDPSIGKGEFANMPKDLKMEMYPRQGGMDPDQDDSMTDIDYIAAEAEGIRRRNLSHQK